MNLTTPTTKQVGDNILAQLQAALAQKIPLLPKAFLRVLAKAVAGIFVLLYKYAGFMFLQIFVRTASIEETLVNGIAVRPLIEWGRLIGAGDPGAATAAELAVTITVETQAGVLPASTQLVGADNGVTYITLAAVALDAPTVQITVLAVSDQAGGGGLGALGNLAPGAALTFANPLANVARAAVVASQTAAGTDGESVDAYRQRVLDRFQKRPQGGAYADYEQWGEEAPGIINVYPYKGDPGQVNVYSEATPASSGSADGIPTAAQLTAVKAAIEQDAAGLASRRSVNAFVNSLAITRTGFDITVTGIAGVGDLAQVRADIETALNESLSAAEPFIPGLAIPPRRDILSRTRLSATVDDIVAAAGGTFTSVALSVTGVGASLDTYTLGEGEKAKVTVVNFL